MFSLFKCSKKEKTKEVKQEVQEETVSKVTLEEESLYDGLLCLRATGEEKAYKDVTGLYEFRGIVYFKPKDGSGCRPYCPRRPCNHGRWYLYFLFPVQSQH